MKRTPKAPPAKPHKTTTKVKTKVESPPAVQQPKKPRKPDPRAHPERSDAGVRRPLFGHGKDLRSYSVMSEKEKSKLGPLDTPDNSLLRRRDVRDFAEQLDILPHEWLAAIAVGRPVPHTSIDIDSGELVELLVVPTFSDRLEAARAAAPYFAAKKAPIRGIEGGTGESGVMELPMAESMQEWEEFAKVSQAKLKETVRE